MDTADIKCVNGKDYLSIPVSIAKSFIAHILSTDLFVFLPAAIHLFQINSGNNV